MKKFLDTFILSFPVLFLKQYPYAWIVVVVLWSWPPILSATFFAVIVVGIASLHWRAAAWISEQRRQFAPGGQTFIIQQPPIPWALTARYLFYLLIGSAAAAWFVDGRIGLGFWQAFLLLAGFAVTYMDARFFGPQSIYIVTETGICIYFVPGHLDYRLILNFKEIGKVKRLDHIEKIEETWSVCSRMRKPQSGVLLVPRNPYGFSKQLQEVLLTPTDVDEFLKHIPSTLTKEI
jgi:hypothetical protein